MGRTVKNRELVKAVVDQASLSTGGELLSQQKAFISTVWPLTALSKICRLQPVLGAEWEATRLGLGKRALVAREEATRAEMRQGVTTSKINLRPFTATVPLTIDEDFLESNIELKGATQTVLDMFAQKAANGIEELALSADLLGAAIIEADYRATGGSTTQYVKDLLMCKGDGFLRLARGGNLLDCEGVSIGPNLLGTIQRTLPVRFRRDKASISYILPDDLSSIYNDKISARVGTVSDEALLGTAPQVRNGSPIFPVPLFPLNPQVVEHLAVPAYTTTTGVPFGFTKVKTASVSVLPTSLSTTAVTAYIEDTDYEVDYDGSSFGAGAAAIRSKSGQALAAGATVKVTYSVYPQVLYTHKGNLIMAIGVDTLKIRSGPNVFGDGTDYMLRFKCAFEVEDPLACVLAHNLSEN